MLKTQPHYPDFIPQYKTPKQYFNPPSAHQKSKQKYLGRAAENSSAKIASSLLLHSNVPRKSSSAPNKTPLPLYRLRWRGTSGDSDDRVRPAVPRLSYPTIVRPQQNSAPLYRLRWRGCRAIAMAGEAGCSALSPQKINTKNFTKNDLKIPK